MSGFYTYFTTPAGDEMVIQTKKEFDRLTDLAKIGEEIIDADDIRAIRERVASGEEETFPHDIIARLVAGENPVRVYRDHRGMTMTALAKKAGLSQSLISEIETGKKEGGIRAMKSLAAALGTTVDDLIWDHAG